MPFERLAALRDVFLGEARGRQSDYWADRELLEAYDRFFGERIRSKWRSVLADAKARGWVPEPGARVVDWGCGTGIASRAFLDTYPGVAASVILFDRSQSAVAFARERVTGVPTEALTAAAPSLDGATVLVSHVANELTESARAELVRALESARAVVWVEPGTPTGAQAIVDLREQLRGSLGVVAPCTHRETCGLLAPENARHWCHFFAAPDPMVFRSADWRRFSETLHVDLRSLPTSYCVLDRSAAMTVPGAVRVVGRARVSTGYATVLSCRASGVRDEKRLKRTDPKLWKRLKDAEFAEYLS